MEARKFILGTRQRREWGSLVVAALFLTGTGSGLFVVLSLSLFLVVTFLQIHLNRALAAQLEGISTEILEGAKKEGKLLWYIASTLEVTVNLNKRFGEKYPFLQTEYYRAVAKLC